MRNREASNNRDLIERIRATKEVLEDIAVPKNVEKKILPTYSWLPEFQYSQLEKLLQNDPTINVTILQSVVIVYLVVNRVGFTKREHIASAVGKTTNHVKDILRVLRIKGYIQSACRYVSGTLVGMRFELNQALCQPFVQFVKENTVIYNPHARLVDGIVFQQHGKTEVVQAQRLLPPQTKTRNIHEPLSTDAAWAEGNGISQQMVVAWGDEMGLSSEALEIALRYAWYDFVHCGRAGTVSSPRNYIYTILKKQRYYPEPDGFRTPEEVEADLIAREAERTIQAAKALRDARSKRERAKVELELETMLENPESMDLQIILNEIPSAERKYLKPGSEAYRQALLAKMYEMKGLEKAS